MIYNKLVECCIFTPNHVGIVDSNQRRAVHYRGGEVGRGDVFDLYLRCNAAGVIVKACFKAYGNPYLVAAAEWLCRQLQDSHLHQHPQFNYTVIAENLAISKSRYAVALQIEDGYREVVQRMKIKLKEEQ